MAVLIVDASPVLFAHVTVEPDCTRLGGVQPFVIVSTQLAPVPLQAGPPDP